MIIIHRGIPISRIIHISYYCFDINRTYWYSVSIYKPLFATKGGENGKMKNREHKKIYKRINTKIPSSRAYEADDKLNSFNIIYTNTEMLIFQAHKLDED